MVKYKLCTHVQIVVELIMFNSDGVQYASQLGY